MNEVDGDIKCAPPDSNNNSNLVSENKSALPNENLNQETSDLDDEIPF